MHTHRTAACAAVLVLLAAAAHAETLSYTSGGRTLEGRLCKPNGAGPFPAVLYNHGGAGRNVGGAPTATCEALASAGFVGFAPIRPPGGSPREQYAVVEAAFAALLQQPYVDRTRLGVMGFSRGAMLSFMAAARRGDLKAAVIMAGGATTKGGAGESANVKVPILVIVAANDTGSRRTAGHNPVAETEEMAAALKAAGKDVTYKVYPSYPGDGHAMFDEIGAYWADVVAFLKKHL